MHGGGGHGVEREDKFLSVAHARRLGVIPRDACGTGRENGQPSSFYLAKEIIKAEHKGNVGRGTPSRPRIEVLLHSLPSSKIRAGAGEKPAAPTPFGLKTFRFGLVFNFYLYLFLHVALARNARGAQSGVIRLLPTRQIERRGRSRTWKPLLPPQPPGASAATSGREKGPKKSGLISGGAAQICAGLRRTPVHFWELIWDNSAGPGSSFRNDFWLRFPAKLVRSSPVY